MNDIRLLALDLDGTLLTSDKHISMQNQAAIQAAINLGIEVVIITGRPLHGLPEDVFKLPGIRYIVTSNGAVTTDIAANRVLRNALISSDLANQIIKIPHEKGLIYSVFMDGFGYCEPDIYHLLIESFKDTPLEDYVMQSRRLSNNLTEAIYMSNNKIENIWIAGQTHMEQIELRQQIQALGQGCLNIIPAGSTDVEIGSNDADKGTALRALAQSIGLKKSQTMAMGDSFNDLGMLEAAGISVAMGNAPAEIQQKASIVTDTNDHDGVAAIINKMLAL